ncbi:MAG: dTDP-4-dehydrorhamnose 3,5-epimerase [Deltaproteobacteria bacterium]
MIVEDTKLAGVKIITPKRFGDNRGYFSETWNKRLLAEHGIDADFVQDNQSMSMAVGTVRGLHYQSPPHAQGKLVRCGRGALWDVAVDARVASPTYGQWIGVDLTAENGRQLWIPAGFLHGFSTLLPETEIIYKCTDYYAPECDGSVRFDDTDIDVDWQISGPPTLSAKDEKAPSWRDWQSPFVWAAP